MKTRKPTTRVRGFAPWNPRAETRALLADVEAVLADLADHLPVSARQIFYRLVARHGFGKTEAAYARLCEALNRARRSGRISFDAIRDDGARRLDPPGWASEAAFLRAFRRSAARLVLDRQQGQPVRLWLLCEAGGMGPQLARVAHPHGVSVLPSGGFDSLTAKHALAREIAAHVGAAEILHVGDLDPSGEHLFSSLCEDATEMALALGASEPAFTRLAVTREQARELGLPSAPPKPTDRRSFKGETVQAEAIDPGTLAGIVRAAIEQRQDVNVRAAVLAEETATRDRLVARLEASA